MNTPELQTDLIRRDDDIWIGPDPIDEYWGELPKEEFISLIRSVENDNSFDLAIQDYFKDHRRKDLFPYITDINGRGFWHKLLTKPRRGVAIDIGAGMGAISEFLAQHYDRVYSVEGCKERCRFLALRNTKKQLKNVFVIHNSVYNLPFADNSIDLVACNGVLEWVGLASNEPVKKIQLAFLAELRRVLKQDGVLYIGIENRFGRDYFKGKTDHPGGRYTSLVPRWLADVMIWRLEKKRNRNPWFSYISERPSYRTYTYSAFGYRHLLNKAGFKGVKVFCVEPSYDIPHYAYPLTSSPREIREFMDLFLQQNYRRWDDKLRCNNYYLFASPSKACPEVLNKPLFFGHFDTMMLEGGAVCRTDMLGTVRREPVVKGTNLIRQPYREISTDAVVRAYRQFFDGKSSSHAISNIEDVSKLLNVVVRRYVGQNLCEKLVNRIVIDHRECHYHGDFWLGNMIQSSRSDEITLIDPESHLFGSPQLDGCDFILDFQLQNRGSNFRNVDLLKLGAHFGMDLNDNELFAIAILRQVLRFSAFHRSEDYVYRFVKLLKNYNRGISIFHLED